MVDPLDIAEKVLGLIKSIYQLWQDDKTSGALAETCYKYIAGVEQALINYKTLLKSDKSIKGNNQAIGNLESSVMALRDRLISESKRGKLSKFFSSSDTKTDIEKLMSKIESDVNSLNLDVSVAVGTNQVKKFNDISSQLDKLYAMSQGSEKEENFKKNFISRDSADIWIKLFGMEHHVNWSEFIKKFSNHVYQTEKENISDASQLYIREILDQDHDQTVTIDEWETFYLRMWTIFSQKAKILGVAAGSIKKSVLKTGMQMRLVTTDSEVQKYLPNKNTDYKFSPNGVVYPDLGGKIIEVKKDLTEQSLSVGREKTEFKPDIYFDRNCVNISNKQFEIFAKATDNQNENGYYIKCVSATNPTSFVVKDCSYILNNQMMINLSQVFYLRVDEVSPAPDRGKADKDAFYVDTNEILQDQNKLDQLKAQTAKDDIKTGQIKPRRGAMKEKTLVKLTLLDGQTKETIKSFEFKAENDNKILNIGSSKDCEIFIDDDEGMVAAYHAQIVYEKQKNRWIVAECYNGGKQKENSENGTFVLMKNFYEAKAADINCPSRGQRLQKGMRVFFSYNILEVTEV